MNKFQEERELMKLRLSNKAMQESLSWYTDFRRLIARFVILVSSIGIYLYFFLEHNIVDSAVGGFVSSIMFFVFMAIIDRAAQRFLNRT
jgi:hypothetical protein